LSNDELLNQINNPGYIDPLFLCTLAINIKLMVLDDEIKSILLNNLHNLLVTLPRRVQILFHLLMAYNHDEHNSVDDGHNE
jgi:hypothetical protein